MLYAAQRVEKALMRRISILILWQRLTAKVANITVNLSSAAGSPKNYDLLVVLVVTLLVAMVNPSSCMAVARNVTAAEHAFCAQVVEKPIIDETRRIVAALWLPAFMALWPMNGYG
jgi:hypothetical protein